MENIIVQNEKRRWLIAWSFQYSLSYQSFDSIQFLMTFLIISYISYLKWRDLHNCEVTWWNQTALAWHPQYLSPFINSCTLNKDTVCHPVSPFSSAKVKELILWKHLSSLKQRCCGNITGVLLITRCLYKQLPMCCVHYRVLSPGVLRIYSHSHTGLLRPVAV